MTAIEINIGLQPGINPENKPLLPLRERVNKSLKSLRRALQRRKGWREIAKRLSVQSHNGETEETLAVAFTVPVNLNSDEAHKLICECLSGLTDQKAIAARVIFNDGHIEESLVARTPEFLQEFGGKFNPAFWLSPYIVK
jgi:hypothetical protein